MIKPPIKIAIAGALRSGKDTVADILQEQVEGRFTVYRFADGITGIIQQYFPQAWLAGKPRQHYQVIGQSLRQLDEDVWVRALHKKRQQAPLQENQLITDLRQPNEVIYCKKHGFKIIKVVADADVRQKRAEVAGDMWFPYQMQHPTEIAVDSIAPDYLIENNGSMDELVTKVTAVYQQILQEVHE